MQFLSSLRWGLAVFFFAFGLVGSARAADGDDLYYDPSQYHAKQEAKALDENYAPPEERPTNSSTDDSAGVNQASPDKIDVNGLFGKEYYRQPSSWSKPHPAIQGPNAGTAAGLSSGSRPTGAFGAVGSLIDSVTSSRQSLHRSDSDVLQTSPTPPSGYSQRQKIDQAVKGCDNVRFRGTAYQRQCVKESVMEQVLGDSKPAASPARAAGGN